MAEKPKHAAGYSPDHVELVRMTCLHIATKLGEFLDDMVIVGGLAPSLMIDQAALPAGVDRHVGTMDLDIGLTIGGEKRTRGRSRSIFSSLQAGQVTGEGRFATSNPTSRPSSLRVFVLLSAIGSACVSRAIPCLAVEPNEVSGSLAPVRTRS
jgi:hypothetical protein